MENQSIHRTIRASEETVDCRLGIDRRVRYKLKCTRWRLPAKRKTIRLWLPARMRTPRKPLEIGPHTESWSARVRDCQLLLLLIIGVGDRKLCAFPPRAVSALPLHSILSSPRDADQSS